jgi:hypothetical protein
MVTAGYGYGKLRVARLGMVHEKKNFFDIDSAKLRFWI